MFRALSSFRKRPRLATTRLSSSSSSSSSSSPAFAGFALDRDFVESHRKGGDAPGGAQFGFNGLGEVVYQRTYSRLRDDLRPPYTPGGSTVYVNASNSSTRGKNSSVSVSSSNSRRHRHRSSNNGDNHHRHQHAGDTVGNTVTFQQEQWFQTVERVVNGTYGMQKRWIDARGLGWDAARAQKSAQRMYALMFDMKFLPPGRGLWAMGTPITEERQLYAALNNCAFVSTAAHADSAFDPVAPFVFLMDASMLGVGVGFDTLAAGQTRVYAQPAQVTNAAPYVVPDSREGWVESLRRLLNAYFHEEHNHHHAATTFDYSEIRPAGVPIAGFGGTSAGPAALIQLHKDVRGVLDKLVAAAAAAAAGPSDPDRTHGKASARLTVTAVVDLMNLIGRCVVSGNVRRTAEIAFGDPHDDEYIDLKNYDKNPDRAAFGWTSNNSIYADLGMDYGPACERVRINGEPGFAWLENMRNYGRMNGQIDTRDHRVSGGNPCLEQSLESFEMCCLVETFPHAHASVEEYLETLRYAFLYAKTVTLGSTHWPQTNRVMLRNRRIGCSMSGVAQFTADRGLGALRDWCEAGYDEIQSTDEKLSEWLSVPRSVKTTSIKPSGTVSLLAGATPGLHFPEARFYIRRVRMPKENNWIVERLQDAGYPIEPAVGDEDRTVVVSFPVDVGEGVRTLGSGGDDVQAEDRGGRADTNENSKNTPGGVSMWEQLSIAAFLQRHWADNQVSCTVTFDPETEGPQLKHALDVFQYQLKGISFLPRMKAGAFAQMPYEEITEEEYNAMHDSLREMDLEPPEIEIQVAVQEKEEGNKDGTIIQGQSDAGERRTFVAPSSVPDSFCDNDSCSI
jgi:hypothetical protein